MKDNINIQEEFESLINELERLKNINEIASLNTENTLTLVTEIEEFVKKLHDYHKSLKTDLASQAKTNEKLASRLEGNIEQLEGEKKELSQIINNRTEDFFDEAKKNLAEISSHVDESIKLLNEPIEELSEKISKSENNIIQNDRALKTTLNSNISNFAKKLEEEIEEQKFSTNKKFTKQGEQLSNIKSVLFAMGAIMIFGFILILFFLIGA